MVPWTASGCTCTPCGTYTFGAYVISLSIISIASQTLNVFDRSISHEIWDENKGSKPAKQANQSTKPASKSLSQTEARGISNKQAKHATPANHRVSTPTSQQANKGRGAREGSRSARAPRWWKLWVRWKKSPSDRRAGIRAGRGMRDGGGALTGLDENLHVCLVRCSALVRRRDVRKG